MQKLLFFVLFASLSVCGFSQQNQQIKVQQQVSSSSGLPELLKGEIPVNMQSDMLAELVLMKAVITNFGELHPTFLNNPRILASAITGDSAMDLIFREYVMTTDEPTHKARETQLLDLY